jgi:uncharacterized membrane protein YozB (DUF420 family)
MTSGKELFAAINATLNGASAILLVIAYIMIRQRKIRAHATLMIIALVLSLLFLGTYVYSKIAYGEQSSGIAPGPLKTFYLSLLASHVLLAIGMLPPIVVTVWRASSRNWEGHKKIARPTIWVWFYVSGTGVIVYWMLYHLFPSMIRGE